MVFLCEKTMDSRRERNTLIIDILKLLFLKRYLVLMFKVFLPMIGNIIYSLI